MLFPILNRTGVQPSDGFYQIEALGEHVNHAARVILVIDAKAVSSIVNRFNEEAVAPDFPGLPVDKDHLSGSTDNPTEAVGWVQALRNRDGIPEAKIAWTAIGRPLVESKDGQPPVYKFFSTEYEPGDCETLGSRIINGTSYRRVRPLRLDGLALTNQPNNKPQKPIANRDQGADDDSPRAQADRITNRANELKSTEPGRSWDDCWNEASDEVLGRLTSSQRVLNRAQQLKRLTPSRRFDECWREAEAESVCVDNS